MPTVILTNWTVYYADDAGAAAGMKQIKWTGSTGTNTLNELYSELMDVFDNASNNDADDSVAIKAVTPTLYEIGSFDAGDKEPWFIDPVSTQHLTGGGLNTSNWTRSPLIGDGTGSIGIIKITRSGSTNIVDADIGATITNSTGSDSGWLLHIDGNNLWIRPATNTAADNWDTTGGSNDLVCNSHTDTQSTAAATGENIYANIYSIGTIVDNTEIYVSQSDALLTQWWSTGHIDILVLVSQQDVFIDNGLLRVFSRQYSTLYDHFETSVATGGRNPIPLATADDLNNDTGYRNMTFSGSVDTYTVGELITGGTSTAQGIVTAISGSPTDDLDYYLVGTVATTFQAAEVITGASSGSNESSVALSDIGPKATTPATITATFGGAQYDLSNGFGNAWYSVAIDCKGETIASVYERLKYITRRGETGDIAADANVIYGEQYQGIGELYIPYDTGSVDNPFTEGEIITGPSSFTGTLTAKHDRGASEGFIVIRDYSGTVPVDGNTLTGVTSTHTALVDDNAAADPVVSISPNKQAAFGSFAGGKFFGARGVYLHNMDANDANNYSLIDSENNSQDPPLTVSTIITVQDLDTATAISGANVLLWATDNANYFYQASVSITGSGTTATVTHATHGLITGDYVMIKGVTNDDDYNGAYSVTVTDVNTYTYTATETLGATPATGVPISTFVFISSATNGSGIVSDTRSLSADQAISGWVRKSSGSPYFKQGVISGTISSTSGFSTTIQLASDE